MIKMLTAHTSEMDFVDDAVSEVLQQLNLDEVADPRRAVGIITCHTEFVQTGVVKALCEHLPFPVVGCTTLGSAASGEGGHHLMAVSVLTGDDVEFSSALSETISPDNVGETIRDAYNRALAGLATPSPALVLVFAPFMNAVDGMSMFSQIDLNCGDAPLYGTLSCSGNADLSGSLTIWNGDAARDVMAIVMIRGNVKPRFFLTALSDDRMGKKKGTTTDSDGPLIRTVDGVAAIDFIESCGITKETVIRAPSSIPVMIDYQDGSAPLACGIYNITPEGFLRVGANVPVGAKFSIGMRDISGILSTAESLLRQIGSETKPRGILMLPCLSRSLLLGANSEGELRLAVKELGDAAPYHIAYSGGEICPVCVEDGKTRNRFHNFTFTACVFDS
ncbi:MAG: FIST C-terminal domain-containing protein [Clostridiales Family XIII bacterium]|jgi:hypothetical protein|nr:FIST C-terminal domain-containing protein [Clostridiales Family XIII bacterium]